MTEKIEELILEQLFNLSNKIDNLHTEMNERFEAQDRKMDDKLEKQKNEITEEFDKKLEKQKVELIGYFDEKLESQSKRFDKKLESQSKRFDEKLDKQKAELIEKIDEKENKIYNYIRAEGKGLVEMIEHSFEFNAKQRKEMEKRIMNKINEIEKNEQNREIQAII